MAVTTTPREILDAAYSKSTKNKPGQIATESTELLQVVIRAMRGLYAAAARVNPYFFAEDAEVAFVSPGWARPELAEAVFRLEWTATTTGGTGAAGDEVVVVPFDDRKAESGMPAVYRFGQIYRPAGNTPDPTGGALKSFYSKRPSSPANLTATVDALWREEFNELLIDEVAIYLALKDGRGEELGGLVEDRNKYLQGFQAHLEHETVNVRHRFGHLHRINTATLLPMLAGGGVGG